jgi:hypothetical protein
MTEFDYALLFATVAAIPFLAFLHFDTPRKRR